MTASRLAALVAAANVAYATSFLVVRPDDPETGGTLASALLLAGGLLAVPVILAVWRRLQAIDRDLALSAAVFGVVGAIGAAVHGGHDLAVAIEPPAGVGDGPNPADPRGLLTFGAAGLSVGLFAWILRKTGRTAMAWLGGALAVGLGLVYVLRLTVVDADNAALVAIAALVGFVLSPAWYVSVARFLGAAGTSAATVRAGSVTA